jgi:hypothetical protein
VNVKVTKKHVSTDQTIELNPRDAAFVFRDDKGMELYLPKEIEPGELASEEALTAAMLAWVMTMPGVKEEMFKRFQKFCDESSRPNKN